MYQFFKWIHIVSYITWLLAFAGSLFLASKAQKSDDGMLMRAYMRYERLVNSIGGHFATLGILISGSAMATMGRWGWFPFQTNTWLAVKQLIFMVILILIVFSVRESIKFRKLLKEEKVNEALLTQTSRRWMGAYRISLAIYLLVAFNTFLGLTKPF